MRCQNELYSTAKENYPPFRCQGVAVVTTPYGMALCQDCAENNGTRMRQAAEKAWVKRQKRANRQR